VCRTEPAFHVHLRQQRPADLVAAIGAPPGAIVLVDGGGPVRVEVAAARPAGVHSIDVAALELCACPSTRHRGGPANDSHSVVPYDRARPWQTGCHTPAGTALRRRRFAVVVAGPGGTMHGGHWGETLVSALAPPQNDHYAEIELRYTAAEGGPYAPPGTGRPPGNGTAHVYVDYRVAPAHMRVRVTCSAGRHFDGFAGRCTAGGGSYAMLGQPWFQLYVLTCAAATALLAWVCRRRGGGET
jgi:hypothetical protein